MKSQETINSDELSLRFKFSCYLFFNRAANKSVESEPHCFYKDNLKSLKIYI